ncbi:glycosyltransferase family 4 protein, partial [bacterium]|nr:glycosyltransferase family 4 protein [bacterium]
MKIGMLLESAFPPDLRVENEMRTLAEAGHEITLLCLNHQPQPATETLAPGITITRRFMRRYWFNKYRVTVLRWPFYPNWWYRFTRMQAEFDVIHVHDLPLARVGARLADKLNIPFVLDLHENWPAAIRIWGHYRSLPGRYFFTDRAWRRYEKRMVARADHVIGVVDEAAERLIQLGVPAEKVTVVSNTLNLAEISPDTLIEAPRDRDVFTLTYFGGLGVHRGLEVAIKAMPIILKDFPNTRLKVLGGGKNLPDLKKLMEKLGVSAAVELAGWQACKNVNDV